jgi:hypothetical protein
MSTSKELLKVTGEESCVREPGIQEFINLNEMIRQALKPFLATGRNKDIIVRCANMPLISGDPDMIQQVCNDLVRMIMQFPGGSQRFLHIKCEEQLPIIRQRQQVSNFQVEFHTNLSSDSHWKQLNHETILACQEKLLACGAVLTVKEILTSGCLFSISLQGKIL